LFHDFARDPISSKKNGLPPKWIAIGNLNEDVHSEKMSAQRDKVQANSNKASGEPGSNQV